MAKHVGDYVEVKTPNGLAEYEIIGVGIFRLLLRHFTPSNTGTVEQEQPSPQQCFPVHVVNQRHLTHLRPCGIKLTMI